MSRLVKKFRVGRKFWSSFGRGFELDFEEWIRFGKMKRKEEGILSKFLV